MKSAVKMPLWAEGRVAGAVSFHAVRAERTWTPAVTHRLAVIASVFGEILARQRRDEEVWAGALEAKRLKEQLQIENVYLRKETRERLGQTRVVGRSPAMLRVLEQIEQVAATDATVLLLGETGTGKELFATEIHERGPRQGRAMVRVNCAAIPATLIESELFGREKGAFTGALARQVGRFELANHSTIFLDEIGDLPLDVQVKLLRVLEARQIERLGSPRPISVDTRIIAATHRDLEQLIGENAFREDLYYRLNVFPIQVPPLRERVQDIPAARLALRRGVLEGVRQAGRLDRQGQPRGAAALFVARQHPRAPQRRGARDDRRDDAAPDDPPAPGVGGVREAQLAAGRRREGAHPRRAREHGLAGARRRRRGRAARVEADDARDADGEARCQTAGPRLDDLRRGGRLPCLAPVCRGPSAIPGIGARRGGAGSGRRSRAKPFVRWQ